MWHTAHPSATNYTIDDSQWSTPSLALTDGWNMLREGGANEWISENEVAIMRPLLGQFWNSSVSWTSTKGAATTISFVGTDVWAYGISGPAQGAFDAVMDREVVGSALDARSEDTNYGYILFEAHGLVDGPHSVVLVNQEEGRSLAFDYAIVQTGQAAPDLPPSASAVPFVTATSSTSPTPSGGLSGLLNATQPTNTTNTNTTSTSPFSLDHDLTSAAAAGGLAPQVTYSPSQLSLLSQKYKFTWNSAAYFVVVFSGMIIVAACAVAIHHVFSAWARRNKRKQAGKPRDGESYLITGRGGRARPSSKILAALKKGKISNPVPSDDGHSSVGNSKRSSGGGASYEDGRGWS